MAVTQLARRKSWQDNYEYAETIQHGATGDTIFIPPLGLSGAKITCRVIAGAGTGKIQTTTSLDSAVKAGNPVWKDWPKGEVTGTVDDVIIGAVSGIRGVSITGEIKIEVKI